MSHHTPQRAQAQGSRITPRRTALVTATGAALLAGGLAGCSNGSGDRMNVPAMINTAQVAALRTACNDNGVVAPGPIPMVRDELFELGQALFFDPILSGGLDVACATCHLPGFFGGDGRTLPGGTAGLGNGPARTGGVVIPRNSPSVLNAHLADAMFWDSRVERLPAGGLRTPAGAQFTPAIEATLEPGLELLGAQAMFPVTSRGEMRGQLGESELGDLADGDFTGIWDALMVRLLNIPGYVTLFQAAYPGVALADFNFGHAGNAIGAFETRAFARLDSPLERFIGGDDAALTADQIQGGLEFFGPADCHSCHSGPAFSDGQHHNIGLPQFGPGKGDGPGGDDDFGRERVSGDPADRYAFRTPTLLNVELTAPYGHLGQFENLGFMVGHYVDPEVSLRNYDIVGNVDDPALVPTLVDNADEVVATLAPSLVGRRNFDVNAVVTFLESLTSPFALNLTDIQPASVPSGLAVPLDQPREQEPRRRRTPEPPTPRIHRSEAP